MRTLAELRDSFWETARQDFINVWYDDGETLGDIWEAAYDQARAMFDGCLSPDELRAFDGNDKSEAALTYANRYLELVARRRGCKHDLSIDGACELDDAGHCVTKGED